MYSNKAMPSILKIGHSTKDPQLRAEELSHTGIPHPYTVEYEILVDEPYQIEQKIHKVLRSNNEGKEWFRCSLDDAVRTIKQLTDNSFIYEQRRAGFPEETISDLAEVVGRCVQCDGDVVSKNIGKLQYLKCRKCQQVFSNQNAL